MDHERSCATENRNGSRPSEDCSDFDCTCLRCGESDGGHGAFRNSAPCAGTARNGMVLTYNGPDNHLGGFTYGGYSDCIVVDENYVLRVPSKLDPAGTASLLCAGITTYSPLRHWNVGKGKKVGIVGSGGWATWA